jgi:hypothetical protein
MNTLELNSTRSKFAVRTIALFVLVTALMIISGCGGHSIIGSSSAQFPAGSVSNDDVEKLLKFDARVESFQMEGNKLMVDVTNAWASAPPGIQARSLGHWYGMWQAANGGSADKQQKGVSVVVNHDGKAIAEWTPENGYRPAKPDGQKKETT